MLDERKNLLLAICNEDFDPKFALLGFGGEKGKNGCWSVGLICFVPKQYFNPWELSYTELQHT